MGAAFEFKPFSRKQKKLMTWWTKHSPHNDKDVVIADGAVRSGKTTAIINGFFDWSLAEFSGQNFILAGKSKGALTRNVINPAKQMLAAKGIKFNHIRSTEEPRIEIGGNKYYLFGANDKSAKDTLQGLTAAGSLLDEVALFPENFVEEVYARCSVTNSKHWWNCNPQGPNHYLKEKYIDQADEKNILRLQFRLDDNLTLSEQIKNRYKQMFDGVFYQRNILGMWVLAEGLVYSNFNRDENIVDELPDMIQHWISIDYGTANPTAFVLVGLGTDNKFYIIDEYRHSGRDGIAKTDKQYAEDLQKFIEKHDIIPQWIFIDPSAKSFITQLYQLRSSFKPFKRVAKANNEVLDGIRRVGSLVGERKMLVHKKCEEIINEFQSYSWDPKKQEVGEDAPIKENDHSLDALRYCISGIQKIYKKVINGR